MIELGFADAEKMETAIERGFVYKDKPAVFGRTFSGEKMWMATVSGINSTVVERTKALKKVFEELGEVMDIYLRTSTKDNLLGCSADVYIRLAVEKPLPSLVKIGDRYVNVSWRKFILMCEHCRQSSRTTSECEVLAQKRARRWLANVNGCRRSSRPR
jgi:hypothetical protein